MFHLPQQYRDKEILIRRIILFAVSLLLIVLYFGRIMDFFGRLLGICFPFLMGAFLAFVFNVIAKSLLQAGVRWLKLKVNRKTRFLAKVLAILILMSLLAVFVFVLFPRIFSSFEKVAENLPASLNGVYRDLLKATREIPPLHDWIRSLDFSMTSISQNLEGLFSYDLVDSVYNIIFSTISVVFNTFLTFMFAVIVLFNKKTVLREGKALIDAYLSAEKAAYCKHVIHLIDNTFSAYIGGSCLECLILGTLVASGSALFRLPYPLLAGLIVGIGALVPMFGAFVAAVLVALFTALESPLQGLYFMILFICIQQVEGNFIYPTVVGKSVGLPPVYVAIAVTVGANVAGILGMIVFIPVTSCLYQIIREDVERRLSA